MNALLIAVKASFIFAATATEVVCADVELLSRNQKDKTPKHLPIEKDFMEA